MDIKLCKTLVYNFGYSWFKYSYYKYRFCKYLGYFKKISINIIFAILIVFKQKYYNQLKKTI